MPFYGTAAGQPTAYQPPVLTPLQQAAYRRELLKKRLGAPPPAPDTGPFSFLPNVIEDPLGEVLGTAGKAIEQVGTALIYSPVGLYETGKAVVQDVADPGGGFQHTRELGAAMGRSLYEDFRHPLRNPGYLAMDLFGLASLGAGSVARLSAAGRVGRAGMEARAVEMGRRPPPPPPSAHIPSTPDEPPLGPTMPGEQTPGELVPRSLEEYRTQTMLPFVRGRTYRVTDRYGKTRDLTFSHAKTSGGRFTHFFRDEEGRPRQVSSTGLEKVEFEKMPPTQIDLTVDRGDGRNALGQFITRDLYKKEEESYSKAMAEIEEVSQPEPPPVQAAPELTPEAPAVPEGPPLKRVQRGPVFEQVSRNAWLGNIGEGKSVGYELVGNEWRVVSWQRGVRNVSGTAYKSAQEAANVARRIGIMHMNRPGGGAPAPSMGQIARDVAGTFLRTPARQTRTIYNFEARPEEYGPTAAFGPGSRQLVTDPEGKAFEMERGHPGRGTDVQRYAKALKDEEQLTMFPEEKRQPLNQVERRNPETGETELATGELVPAEIMLSRNPLMRLIQNLQLDFMERNPDARSIIPGPYMGRSLKTIHKYNKGEADRITKMIEASGSMDEAKEAAYKYRQLMNMGASDQAKAVLDSMNMTAKLAVLFTKPAYYTANMIGQLLLTASDHAWSPRQLAATARLQWDMHKRREIGEEAETNMDAAMFSEGGSSLRYSDQAGLGILPHLREKIGPRIPMPGGKRKIPGYEQFASFSNALLDTRFRRAAFIREARRAGYDTGEKINDLLLDPARQEELVRVAREANKNIIDYARMGPREKEWIRRIVFFYPWFKGATVYAGRFISQRPGQAVIATQMGKAAQAKAAEELGPLPSYLRGAGVFKVGERNVPGLGPVPTVVNPQAAGVLGTAGEAAATAKAALFGGGGEAHQLLQYLTPGVSAGLSALFRRDPFTGAEYPATMGTPEIISRQFLEMPAFARLLEQRGRARDIESGALDPSGILHPYSEGEALGRFGLGVAPYALNPTEARSRAFAEQQSLASRREREILAAQEYTRRYARAGQELGVFEQMPAQLSQALGLRGQREAEIAALEGSMQRELTPLDRLQSDVNLLVRRGELTAEQGRTMIANMIAANENQITTLRNRLGEAYYGSNTISQYRGYLNALGAGLTV